jgi:hypothetical protein
MFFEKKPETWSLKNRVTGEKRGFRGIAIA